MKTTFQVGPWLWLWGWLPGCSPWRPGSVSQQSVYDLLQTAWHWKSIYANHLGFPLSTAVRWYSVFIYSMISRMDICVRLKPRFYGRTLTPPREINIL